MSHTIPTMAYLSARSSRPEPVACRMRARVAVSPAGDLYISDFANNDILKFNAAGVFQSVFASGPNVDVPLGLTFGTGGDLFVASAGAVSNIARVDQNTGLVTNPSFTSGNVLVLGGPQYLTSGPSLR